MTEITAPTQCPECSSLIVEFTEEKSGITTHWCENIECPGRIADMLTFAAGRTLLEIEGLGPEMATALAKGGYVVTLADLFEFCAEARKALDRVGPERFGEGMRKKGLQGAATIKMIETVERAKSATWDRWIAALGIPMIGHTLGKVLAKELELGSEAMILLPGLLMTAITKQIDGIGVHKNKEIETYATSERFVHLCTRLHQVGVRPTPLEKLKVVEGAPLEGMAFCITGEFYEIGSREYISRELVKLGAVSKSGVSKKVTHLLVGTEPGRTKLTKADELKIPQKDETWLAETLAKHGIKVTGSDLAMEWAD